MKKSKRTLCISALIVLIMVALDQLTKYLAVTFLKDQEPFVIMKEVFEFRYLENRSAAFGMDPISLLHRIFDFQIFNENPQLYLQVRMGFLVILTIAVILFLTVVYTKIPEKKKFIYLDIILVAFVAGGIGNFIDRIVNQYVIDFLYFKLIDFPIFNVADIYVTTASFAMVVFFFFYYKEEDFEEIFPSKKKPEAQEKKKHNDTLKSNEELKSQE